MDIRKVKKLIEMMEESDIREIEVKEGEDSVRISRGGAVMPYRGREAAPEPAPADAPAASRASGRLAQAPMAGTFYRGSSPGSPPYVNIGDRVKAGDTLCIIESMKMMNEIKAEFAGQIEAILVDNEAPVEIDQGLFTIA